MKICPVCHTESDDSAKFCQECGTAFPAETENKEDQAVSLDLNKEAEPATEEASPIVLDTEKEEMPADVQVPAERWYYVEAGKSKGPFSRDEFTDLIASGTITPATYVWSKGMNEWTYLKNTDLYTSGEPAQEPAANEGAAEFVESETFEEPVNANPSNGSEAQEWYYVVNSRTVGPFSEAVMIRNIQQGVLDGSTYVWKEGYADWKHLSDTPLAAYLPVGASSNTTTFTAPENHTQPSYGMNNPAAGVVPVRSVLLYLLLSIVTCGIFEIVWLYLIASDINKLCARKGRPTLTDPILVVIFSLLTCQIFSVYYFWKAGNTVYELSDRRLSDNSVVLAILGVFLQPAALAILQDQINSLVTNND